MTAYTIQPPTGSAAGVSAPPQIWSRLANAARGAYRSNPLTVAPWLAPPAWITSTVYATGDLVKATNGYTYTCVIGGTSGVTEPSTTTDGINHSDGGVSWCLYGSPQSSANDPLAPTLNITSTAPASQAPSLTNNYLPSTTPNVFDIRGAYTIPFSTTGWQFRSFSRNATTFATGSPAIGFRFTGVVVAIGLSASSGTAQFMIDGRFYSPTSYTVPGSNTYYVFTFPAWGTHDFVVFTGSTLLGVYTVSYATVSPTPLPDRITAVILGDSLMDGSSFGPFLRGLNCPHRLCYQLGWYQVWNMSTAGTGLLNDAGSSYYTYRQRIPEAITRNPDLWIIFDEYNDFSYGAVAIQQEALLLIQAIRTAGSTAPIFFFGTWSVNNASVITTEAAVSAAITASGDQQTFWCPIYGDAAGPWVTFTARDGTGKNNSAMYVASTPHFADIGTVYQADRMAGAIRNIINTYVPL